MDDLLGSAGFSRTRDFTGHRYLSNTIFSTLIYEYRIVDLRQLRYFIAVAETGSFARGRAPACFTAAAVDPDQEPGG